MRKRIAALVLLALLSGLTACGKEAGEPPAVPEEPAVSVDPSPTRKGTGTAEETPENTPEASAGTVEYYESGEGLMIYATREAFLAENGLEDAPLFYTFRMDEETGLYDEDGKQTGTKVLTRHMDLYYDEETEMGCGLWYYENLREELTMQGFLFTWTVDGTYDSWHQWDRWKMDYFAIPDFEEDWVEDYQEHYEYDEAGRLTAFRADGIYETPWETEQGRNPVFRAEFIYDEDGNLQCRDFGQYVFGTTGAVQYSYFDDLGRVYYEWAYITHGRLEYYYIYEGDDPEPAYCLFLDHDIDVIRAEFARY